jgi:hypothetical protein
MPSETINVVAAAGGCSLRRNGQSRGKRQRDSGRQDAVTIQRGAKRCAQQSGGGVFHCDAGFDSDPAGCPPGATPEGLGLTETAAALESTERSFRT